MPPPTMQAEAVGWVRAARRNPTTKVIPQEWEAQRRVHEPLIL